MATVSAGLVKVQNLTVTGTQSGAIQATNIAIGNLDLSGNLTVGQNFTVGQNVEIIGSIDVSGNVTVAQNFTVGQNVEVGQNITTPLLTVSNITGTTDLNNQLTSIQYAVGVDPNASISDQDALKELSFLSTFMANLTNALNSYNDDPTSTNEVSIFTGEFNYINPTDGSGYVGQMWKGDFNPLVQYYMGPSGEETREVNSLGLDVFTYSAISIAFLVKFNTDAVFINQLTPFYRKSMEEYDNPSLYVNFRVSMYNQINYLMKTIREQLDLSDETEAQYASLLIGTEALMNNEIAIVNSTYQFSGYPSFDGYQGNVTGFDAFTSYWGYTGFLTAFDSLNLGFPLFDQMYANGVDGEPGPEWKAAVANNMVKYFKAFGKQLNYWAKAFQTKQPMFHKYANGATGSQTLGYTNDSNTFQYYNPLTEQTETQIKYKVPANGTTTLQQESFTTLVGYNTNSDFPYTGFSYPFGSPIGGVFSLPGKWWEWLRNDYILFFQDFKAMYDYLLTLTGGQAVIDACQVVWENEVLPASANCYAQFKYCKTNNLIDDEYVGAWRNSVNKNIDHIDVLTFPYTVYLKDGTTIPLNDEGILNDVRTQNNIISQMICKQPTSSVSAFTKIDSSQNYTNYTGFQNITDNYSVVEIPISVVTPDILSGADTVSNTAAGGVVESGIQLAKYFDDLESYAIYAGLGDGSIQIPLYPGGPDLQQNQFNTDVSGTVWNIQTVYERFLDTLGQTKPDWEVLGYYYGRHPTDPLYNVYNPVIFDGPVDASGYATDSSGNNVYQRRALQGGNNQYVLEGGHTGSDASGWDNPSTLFQLVYDGSGATPYRSTRVNIASVPAPLTNYVVRSNYSPETIPVCLDFDYCLVEHYKINQVTGRPLIENDLYQVQVSAKWINGTKGNQSVGSAYINRDRWRCRSLANQIDNRVFSCWYNFMINKGGAATYKDSSNNDTSGNGIYSPGMINYIKNNFFFGVVENRSTGTSANGVSLPSGQVAGFSWYSDTYGCEGAGYSGPTSIPGRNQIGYCINSSIDPQRSVRAQYNMTISSHELFGHGIQLAYNRSQFTTDPVPWTTAATSDLGAWLKIRDNHVIDGVQGTWQYVNYTSGVSAEGYATIMEIMCTKYGLYRLPNLATIDLDNNVDSFIVLYALLNLSRIVSRLLCVGGNSDPSAGAGKGDVSTYPWICQTFPLIQKILNLDSPQRIVYWRNQMVTYAFGLIGNLSAINQILATSFPTDPDNFKQYNFNYWRMTEAIVLTGDSLITAALAKPRSFWVDEIVIPNNP